MECRTGARSPDLRQFEICTWQIEKTSIPYPKDKSSIAQFYRLQLAGSLPRSGLSHLPPGTEKRGTLSG